MATVKLTIKRGAQAPKDITVAAGTVIAGSDAIEVNIDQTKMTKGEAVILLDQVKAQILRSKWPQL
jgi:hypothetical protein